MAELLTGTDWFVFCWRTTPHSTRPPLEPSTFVCIPHCHLYYNCKSGLAYVKHVCNRKCEVPVRIP